MDWFLKILDVPHHFRETTLQVFFQFLQSLVDVRLDASVIELVLPQLLHLQLFEGPADAVHLSLCLLFV